MKPTSRSTNNIRELSPVTAFAAPDSTADDFCGGVSHNNTSEKGAHPEGIGCWETKC